MAEITIVVPVYNVEKVLKRCVESILNQTFQNFQVILVNDGSTDKSGEICDEFAKISDKVHVIHQENGGLSSARNAGIDMAKSPYIGFVDSDDYLEKGMFQILVEAIDNADIASVDYVGLKEGEIPPNSQPKLLVEVYENDETVKQLLVNPYIHRSAWNKLYKLELFEGLRYPEGKIFEDTFTTYKLYARAKKVVATNYQGYYYMHNDDSITRRDFTPKNFDLLSETQRLLEDMETHYPHLLEYEQARLAEHYVGLAMRILNSKENPDNKAHMNQILQGIREDYPLFKHNKRVGAKIRTGIKWMNFAPKLFFMMYKLAKRGN